MTLHEKFGGDAWPPLVRCEVSKGASSLTDSVEVKVEGMGDYTPEVLGWMPRGAVLPTEGDEGLIGYDQNREPWLLVWFPA